MILPFFISSTAVVIFRQYFLQLPKELFEAARIDGAGDLRLLWNVALPLVRPALLTTMHADVHRSVERVPVAVPHHQGREPGQPLAVSLANYITSGVASSTANPFGAVTAGALVLAVPVGRPVHRVHSATSSRATSARA